MNNAKLFKYTSSLLLAASLSGCNTIGDTVSNPLRKEKSVENVTLDYDLVKYTLVSGYKQTQKQNEVSLTLEPVSVEEPEVKHRITATQEATFLTLNGQMNYSVLYEPFIQKDDRIKFTLKIANNHDRVIRPSNSVVTFKVDNQSSSVSSENYQDFINSLITPNSSKEIVISGPRLSEIKGETGTIAIDIYELKVGEQYSNYSWVIDYKKIKSQVSTTRVVEPSYMTPQQAYSINGKAITI
ncbi:hypothetical protein [Pseudoalteromonas rubra]|jgi:hypothetical protein|uniref:hypothetical protein n=1 Tax=Pseudoalteromonas rubra TaxID=43658 RepID=UPI002DBC252C|nr:hypothetical protein [Pseudoalteromonas rubra]MEC4090925.1 hypothetical protein [Pseudoalteromonas rubra]